MTSKQIERMPADFSKADKVSGTSYHGYCVPAFIGFDRLKNFFGFDPSVNVDPKCKAHWAFYYRGEVCTLYDYKGDRWHIGASSPELAKEVMEAIEIML